MKNVLKVCKDIILVKKLECCDTKSVHPKLEWTQMDKSIISNT